MEYSEYRKKNTQSMRKYIVGENLDDRVSVSEADANNGSPKEGDMIAVSKDNADDMWLVSKEFFEANYEPVN